VKLGELLLRNRTFLLAVLLSAAPAFARPAYKVVQTVEIPDGKLQVLEDARLTGHYEELLWERCADPSSALEAGDPTIVTFEKSALLRARYRQVDAEGKIVVEFRSKTGIARIEPKTLGTPGHPFYLIRTSNNVACMGSYAGEPVYVYEFVNGRISAVKATNARGKSVSVDFYDSLKSSWRVVRDKPNDIEIEELYCRPDFEREEKLKTSEGQFKLIYFTYHYDGLQWRVAQREEPGFWEADDDFPPPSKFPHIGN
jgi:hypothetical protein